MSHSDSLPYTPPDERLVQILADVLSDAPEVTFAYLFGSVAKGRVRAASDVDVAVHLGGRASTAERVNFALDLEGALESAAGRSVQVVVLDDAPLELRFNVLAHGIALHARDVSARRRFYVDTGRRYYDMAPARALFGRKQRERIRKGTFGG